MQPHILKPRINKRTLSSTIVQLQNKVESPSVLGTANMATV